jgi:3-oxoacyl-[acyl-carrier-protein] synthase II
MIIPPGYGIPAADAADIKAIHHVFSSRSKPWVVAMRGATGDCGAGSQALDIVAAAMALHQQTVPPGINTLNPLDGINVPHTPQTGTPLHHVLVAASSMAGQNSVVVLKKYV